MLKQEIIDKIRKDKTVKLLLALELNKSYPSIVRYIDNNDIILTTDAALNIISSHFNIPKEELLTTTKAAV